MNKKITERNTIEIAQQCNFLIIRQWMIDFSVNISNLTEQTNQHTHTHTLEYYTTQSNSVEGKTSQSVTRTH